MYFAFLVKSLPPLARTKNFSLGMGQEKNYKVVHQDVRAMGQAHNFRNTQIGKRYYITCPTGSMNQTNRTLGSTNDPGGRDYEGEAQSIFCRQNRSVSQVWEVRSPTRHILQSTAASVSTCRYTNGEARTTVYGMLGISWSFSTK